MHKLFSTGHLATIQNVEDSFESPVVKTAKKDRSVEIATDSTKQNDSSIKMRPHMPNMEELLNQISTGITRVRNEPLWVHKIHLEYAYDQVKLSQETSRQYNFALIRGNKNESHRFTQGFYRLSGILTKFQKKSIEH